MSIPKTLDDTRMIGLNTLIACHGAERAEAAYLSNCKRVERAPEAWAIQYLRLYVKYASPKAHPYLDVPAAKRALSESAV